MQQYEGCRCAESSAPTYSALLVGWTSLGVDQESPLLFHLTFSYLDRPGWVLHVMEEDLLISELTSSDNRTLSSSLSTRALFAKSVFGDEASELDFRTFFEYYDAQIADLQSFEKDLAGWTWKSTLMGTHKEMLNILQLLRKEGVAHNRGAVRDRLRKSETKCANATDEHLDWAINTTLRLCLFVGGLSDAHQQATMHSPIENWKEGTLHTTLDSHFLKTPKWKLKVEEGRYDPRFTAAFMVDVCGLKIRWTDNLQEHLEFDRRRFTLAIFRQKACLHALLRRTKAMKDKERSVPSSW